MEASSKVASILGSLKRFTGTQFTVALVTTLGIVVVALALVVADYTVHFSTNETDVRLDLLPAIAPPSPRGSNAGLAEEPPTGRPGP